MQTTVLHLAVLNNSSVLLTSLIETTHTQTLHWLKSYEFQDPYRADWDILKIPEQRVCKQNGKFPQLLWKCSDLY